MVLVMVTVVLSAAPLPCMAGEKVDESIWVEDEPGRRHRRFELEFDLTDEKIEQAMNRLAETDPEKAKELKELREEDSEKFKTELRKILRERLGRRFREHRERGFGPHGKPGMPGMREPTHLLEWLEENYPEEAEELAKLQEEEPELYRQKRRLSMRKYGRIAGLSKVNPRLSEVLKEDLELKQRRDALLEKLETVSGDEREELVAELKEVVSNRFDLIVERKQIEYEQLLKRLEKLKEKVEQSEAEVEKWKDAEFKDENIKARVGELLGQTGKFDWD
jgi:hypothetical protein